MDNKKIVKAEPRNLKDALMARIGNMVQDGKIHFPKNYSPENAVNSAFLILREAVDKFGKPVLQVCTRESISNAILNMVLLGLSPAKSQCYFIARGKSLTLMTSYFGEVAVAKSVDPRIVDVFGMVVYEKDEFEFEIVHARRVVTKHKQSIGTIDNTNIVAAYCTIVYKEDDDVIKEYTEVMPWAQIVTSWKRGQTKGGSSAHREQPEEMAKRTVTKRALKWFVNTSNDMTLGVKHDAYAQVQRAQNTDEIIEAEAETIEDQIDIEKELIENEPETIQIPENFNEPDSPQANLDFDDDPGY